MAVFAMALLSSVSHAAGVSLVTRIDIPGVAGRLDHLAFDPQRGRLFVSALGANEVEVIDLNTAQRAARLEGQREPQGVIFDSASQQLLVANGDGDTIDVFKAERSKKTIEGLSDADNLRLDRSSGRLYAGYSSGLAVIDPATLQILDRIALPGHPEAFELSPVGSQIYVNVPSTGAVVVVDRHTGKETSRWSVLPALLNFPMALDQAGHRLFIATRMPSRLLVFDTASGHRVAQRPLCGDADDREQMVRLLGQFRGMLVAYDGESTDARRGAAVGHSLQDLPQQFISECDEYLAFAENNYLPFMLRPYALKRALVFECLEVIQPMPTYTESPFADALGWVLEHRNSHKEYLRPVRKCGGEDIDLKWFPERWRKLILAEDADGNTLVHRKYLELMVFMRIFEELQSGDLFVPHSDQYDDYRAHFMDDERFKAEMPLYTKLLNLAPDGPSFVAQLQDRLTEATLTTDRAFPKNDSVAWGPTGLIIRKTDKVEEPPQLKALDQAINDALGLHSIIDVLTEVGVVSENGK